MTRLTPSPLPATRRWLIAGIASLLLLGAGSALAPITASAAGTPCTMPSGAPTVNVDTTLGCDNTAGFAGIPYTGWFNLASGTTGKVWLALAPTAGAGGSTNPNDALDGNYTLTVSSCGSGGGGMTIAANSTYSIAAHSAVGVSYSSSGLGGFCAYSLTFSGPAPLPTVAVEVFNQTIGSIWGYSAAVLSVSQLAVFPAMSNGAYGGYVTASTIQNIGSAPAMVRIAYFNQSARLWAPVT